MQPAASASVTGASSSRRMDFSAIPSSAAPEAATYSWPAATARTSPGMPELASTSHCPAGSPGLSRRVMSASRPKERPRWSRSGSESASELSSLSDRRKGDAGLEDAAEHRAQWSGERLIVRTRPVFGAELRARLTQVSAAGELHLHRVDPLARATVMTRGIATLEATVGHARQACTRDGVTELLDACREFRRAALAVEGTEV